MFPAPMERTYQCPACKSEVDKSAAVCGNPACRKELAFCSHCRDVTTLVLVEEGHGRLGRDKYRCDRCERLGVKCLTWKAGGYCNGLARAAEGKSLSVPLCANCSGHVVTVGRSVAGWAAVTAIGTLLRRRK